VGVDDVKKEGSKETDEMGFVKKPTPSRILSPAISHYSYITKAPAVIG
jgi:hypothetical protein